MQNVFRIPINGVVREVPIGPHTVARFYVQPEREEHFECALCGLLTTTNRQPVLGFSFCQGHDVRSRLSQGRVVARVPEYYERIVGP